MAVSDQEPSSHRFEPDYSLPPGTTLRSVIEKLGMSQSELALRSGLSLKHVNQIVHGFAPITPDTSLSLEKITGVPAQFWNNLEVNHRDRQARSRNREVTDDDKAWLASLPIRELERRRKLAKGLSPSSLLQEVCRFFGVANRETWERVWRAPLASFRRSPSFQSDMPALASWLRLGELEANDVQCLPFDAKKFRDSLREIRPLTCVDDFSDDLVRLCASSGVAVVFVKEITGCRTSGAARWLSPSKGLIQLSDRYKRDDQFWFSFFHEAGHLLIHGKKETFVSNDDHEDVAEEEADRFAATTLIPRTLESRISELHTRVDVKAFADEIGIAPGIVVGRLQKEGVISWSALNSLKRKLEIVE